MFCKVFRIFEVLCEKNTGFLLFWGTTCGLSDSDHLFVAKIAHSSSTD